MTTEDKTAKIRKPHKCRICGEILPAGSRVVTRAGLESDGPWRVWMHSECEYYSQDWDDGDWETAGPGDVSHAEVIEAVCQEAGK